MKAIPAIWHPAWSGATAAWGRVCRRAWGTALALGLRKREGAHVYVLMGDGEQSKGQLQEAIELAAKYRLSRLTAIVDMNGQQSSGTTQQVNGRAGGAALRGGRLAGDPCRRA